MTIEYLSDAFEDPERCSLTNIATGEMMTAMFNPTQFGEKIGVNWGTIDVQALSFQPLFYKNTSNQQLSGLEFFVHALGKATKADIADFRRFLLSLTVPAANAAGVVALSPPSLIFSWPGLLSYVCKVKSLEFGYERFARTGHVIAYRAKVDLERYNEKRITSEMMRDGY